MQKRLKYILDIGTSNLRLIAVANLNKKNRIIAEEVVLYDGYMDGEFFSIDELENKFSTLIENMSKKMRKPINSITIGTPNEFCVCVCKRITRKYVELHKVTDADLKNLYESNASFGDSFEYNVINFSPMQFVLDDSITTLSPVGKKVTSLVLDASYILAKRSFIELMLEKFNTIGITQVDFISTMLGQAMNCEPVKKDNKPIAIVDVGHITTSVGVFKGEGMALMSSFAMGGGHISSDIMQVLGLGFADAEIIKRKVILTIDSIKNEDYEACLNGGIIKTPINITNQVVKTRIEMISKIVADILSVNDVFKGIDIYLTGDGIANFKGAKNILKDATKCEVYEYKIEFDNSKGKYQTSKTGLARLCEEVK